MALKWTSSVGVILLLLLLLLRRHPLGLQEWHPVLVIHLLVYTGVDRSKVLAKVNVFEWIIARGEHLLCVLAISHREEVGFRVETPIWNRLVTLLPS